MAQENVSHFDLAIGAFLHINYRLYVDNRVIVCVDRAHFGYSHFIMNLLGPEIFARQEQRNQVIMMYCCR